MGAGADAVDFKLVSICQKGNLVVTQDYGVAAMALGKGARALNQNGLIYDAQNMDRLLFERHLGQKIRRAGKKAGTTKKRTQEDNESFERALAGLIEDVTNNKGNNGI